MSIRQLSRCALLFSLLVALAFTPGCGGDDGPSSPDEPIGVSGQFVKGPVSGASVTLHDLAEADTPGTLRGGPFTTDASGRWSGEIPAGARGPFLIVATGGSFVDEASAATVAVGDAQVLGYASNGSGIVTPYTHALAFAAAARGGSATTAWTSVLSSFESAFGFDPTTTTPALDGSTAGKTYFALLGGLSELLDTSPALGALADAEDIDLIVAFAKDLSDGRLDGLQASAGGIEVSGPGGALSWPALDGAGIGALIDAANTWAATIEGLEGFVIEATELDFNPTGGGDGSGSLAFSGPGAALLPFSTFEPVAFSVNQGALAWADADGLGYSGSVGVSRSPGNDARASIVSVTIVDDQNSYGWYQFNFETSIPGVTLDGNTVTFTNVTLSAITGTALTLTINGQLGE